MNKTLALIALLGLVSSPVLAAEGAAAPAAPAKAEKVVAKDAKGEAAKEGEVKAEDAAKEGEAKKEEKK